VFEIDFNGVFDEMLAGLTGDSVIDGNAKYLVGNEGDEARALEEAKLAAIKISE